MIQILRDTLWKGIIEDLFAPFLLYFFAEWAKQNVDFSKPFEFLDKELDSIAPDKENSKRYADKLVKVFLKNGTAQFILVHIEVQGYQDDTFAERMFVYFYRILDKYGKRVMAIALLTDNNAKYKPQKYVYEYEGTKNTYQFPIFKLLHKTEKELNVPNNPFSIVMLTAKKALNKANLVDSKQFIWKRELILALREANYSEVYIRSILRFIRFYVHFNTNESLQTLNNVIRTTFNQRKNMGIEEAIMVELREQAMKEGIQQGMQQGIQQGMQQGIQQGMQQERLRNQVLGIKKALKRGKLTLEEIAEDFEVTLDFVLQVQKGSIVL